MSGEGEGLIISIPVARKFTGYDFYLFQMADGVSAEKINRYVKRTAKEQEARQSRNEEHCTDPMPPIPQRFFNAGMDMNELKHMVYRSTLWTQRASRRKGKLITEYLNGSTQKLPKSFQQEFDAMFQYGGGNGVLPLTYFDTSDKPEKIAFIIAYLGPQRIALFERDINKAYDANNYEAFIKDYRDKEEQTLDRLIEYLEKNDRVLKPNSTIEHYKRWKKNKDQA